MQYYAVIDTNVIVSAMLKWNSIPGSILELTLDGPITPVLNREILDEYRQVLLRPKFHLTANRTAFLPFKVMSYASAPIKEIAR